MCLFLKKKKLCFIHSFVYPRRGSSFAQFLCVVHKVSFLKTELQKMSILTKVEASKATTQKMFNKGTPVEVSSDEDGFAGA